MFAALAFGAALAVTGPVQDAAQTPPAAATQQDDTIRLEDVVVNARRLEEATEAFVGEVAAPVPRRGYARWHNGVCVGVVNLSPEVSQVMVDRVSDRARELGLTAGAPGCHPSILIVATRDATPFTAEFVAMRPRLFRTGATGMDRGGAAFRNFMNTDRPVRWWVVSQPTDSDTGQSAVRMQGQCNRTCTGTGSAVDYAPNTQVRSTSRIQSPYRQDMKRTFVIVDVDRLNGVSLEQLSDYIAMVSLAQVDQDADTSSFDTILNLFDSPGAVNGLTGWDNAYLQGLYEAEWYRINQSSQVRAVANTIEWKYRDGVIAEETAEGQ
ncbi:MAG: hypothetical protein EON48_11930 [Acetobacteraceae bacterium]|nr:MAG: hypothetical protein EON48_11930 [Acetobacteraceae bacterium]